MTKTIVLVHGAWLNSLSFEHVKARYQAQGYTVIVPDWLHDDRSPAELRANPNPALARTGQRDIVAHYEKIIRALPEKPILIGHSLGAVFVQHLLERGLGVAGVAINPAPTPGVPLGPHAIVSALPVFGDPLSWRKAKTMTLDFFRTRFAQTIPAELVEAEYNRYVIPTAGLVYWNGVINPMKIDFAGQDRAPLLLIGGGKDLIADASMTRAIFKKQKKAKALTELKVYEDRSHWTLGDAGWEEVADYALNWAVTHATDRVELKLVA
ncbi:alpha/beta hydrolase [Devosia sediminis]|uniref:Alpha/beta hydrolase n=1 Tax=Devosia sediminis TaxID=2798801 RepID=A0A934IWR0_9HYPH|nr:alpha/beta hydrolase [Devosia sediminis]MBJ3785767.1 alpha/beta hydrolase [Devosia sediminis]